MKNLKNMKKERIACRSRRAESEAAVKADAVDNATGNHPTPGRRSSAAGSADSPSDKCGGFHHFDLLSTRWID
jgi:hypothetical protein